MVVYYSATGTTKGVAEKIAEETGDWQDGERLSEDEVPSWVRDNF